MAVQLTLVATTRQAVGRHAHSVRREGQVPAVLYGHNVTPQNLSTEVRELEKVWHRAGRTHLVDLTVDGGDARKVLIQALQRNPRNNQLIHVDLYAVNLKEKLTADVPLVLVGEAPAVSEAKIGQLLQTLSHVRISCLPQDLPAQFSVDVSGLTEVEQAITLGEVQIPQGVELLHDLEETVVKVAPLRVQAPEDVEEATEAVAPAPGETAEA